jgi:tRNA dimethylallyltransferase
MLHTLDPTYMGKIPPGDRYRIEKALLIYFATQMVPSDYFRAHPPQRSIIGTLPLYRITVPKEKLRARIHKRTRAMMQSGLIDEVAMLERRYTREPPCMKAIGIKETLAYLDGRYDKKRLLETITTHTARLAKRQTTFSRTQFDAHPALDRNALREKILEDFYINS